MISNDKGWKKLFLLCLGLALGTGFCMKWMEPDFMVSSNETGEMVSFNMLEMELFYSGEKLQAILAGIDNATRTILKYHLVFDFGFMAGVFPGIASLCMLSMSRLQNPRTKTIVIVLAGAQLIAWAFDIAENYYLLIWIRTGEVGNNIHLFHFFTWSKWAIALLGLLFSLSVFAFRKKYEVKIPFFV